MRVVIFFKQLLVLPTIVCGFRVHCWWFYVLLLLKLLDIRISYLHRKVGLNDNDSYHDVVYPYSWYLESIFHNSFIEFILYYLFPFSNCITILSLKLALINLISYNSILSLHLSIDAYQLLLISVYQSSIIIFCMN